MSVYAVSRDIWELDQETDRRFYRTLALIGIPVLLIALVIPMLELHGLQRGGGLAGQAQYVEFIDEPAATDEQAEEPAPVEDEEIPTEVPEPEPAAEQAPVVEEKPPVLQPQPDARDRTERAREQARQAGVLAMADALADLRSPELAGLDAARPLRQAAASASSRERPSQRRDVTEQIAASAARSSGGVASSQVQRREAGTGLGERRTTTVERPKGFGDATAPQAGQGGDKPFAGRSIDEVQLVMDRNKGSFYALYNRELRSNPYLQGTIIVSITIEPSGRVSDCKVVESTTGSPEFDEKICTRIRLINFGAKNVPTQTIPSYPLYFQELG